MRSSATLAVAGGDVRQAHLAALLRDSGCTVRTFALGSAPVEGCTAYAEPHPCFAGAQAVILPLPVQRGDGQLNAPLADAPYALSGVLDAIPSGTLTLAGSVPFWVHARAVQNNLHLIDYLTRDELAIRNAIPTCEGAIQLAMEQTDCTLHGAQCLVIGCGRIGALLARKLHALDACVTVSARAPRDFARIEAAGMRWLDTRRLAGRLAGFDLVFNTVPAPVLGETELEELKPGCVVIDLASLPGGIAPDLAAPPACRVLHALSLPGRVAPRSAARAIYDTVRAILQEEGIV